MSSMFTTFDRPHRRWQTRRRVVAFVYPSVEGAIDPCAEATRQRRRHSPIHGLRLEFTHVRTERFSTRFGGGTNILGGYRVELKDTFLYPPGPGAFPDSVAVLVMR